MSDSTALKRRDIPLYRQLDAILRDQIVDGRLRPGDRFPPETVLCRHYGISRATVRQALDAMEKDGLIERAAGRGTFLRPADDTARPASGRSRSLWHDVIGAGAARAGTELRFGTARPPAIVARELDLDGAAETPFFIRVLTDAAGPRAGLKRYFRPDLAPLLTRKLRAAPDFTSALGRAAEAAVTCSSFWVEALLAEPRFAMMLKVPLGSPVLSIWWVERLGDRPAICSQMLQPGADAAVAVSP